MVRNWILFFGLWLGGMTRLLANPVIDASIDGNTGQANYPVEGTITITHKKTEKIDPQSFIMNGKPFETLFVRDVSMSLNPDTLVTIYSFQLPAQEKGLYVLSPISVKIGNQTYQAIASSYEIKGAEGLPKAAPSAHPASQPKGAAKQEPLVFRLEAMVKGSTELFPGGRTKLFYRISYNRSIDLTNSVLPMIHPPHFQKIGDVHIRDYQQQNLTIQDLTQEIEASDLGTFQLGPSKIEGYAYTMQAGQKVYDPTLLQAEAPVVTLEVKPFPKSAQPASFTGGLGSIKVEASLKSAVKVAVGENLQLEVKISGISNLTDFNLPPLKCQPGYSGFFQTSDLPPLAEIKEKTKVFQIELRPIASLTTQIPALEVSSFDAASGEYVTQETSPIPIEVFSPLTEKASLPSQDSVPPLPAIADDWPTPSLLPLEFQGKPVELGNLKTSWTKTPWVLWLFPAGLLLLLMQMKRHRTIQQRPKLKVPQSEELLKRALSTRTPSLETIPLLEQAFWKRLWEKGIVSAGAFQLERLPLEGKLGAIRSFLLRLQALQYSPDKAFDWKALQQEAKQLFYHIR